MKNVEYYLDLIETGNFNDKIFDKKIMLELLSKTDVDIEFFSEELLDDKDVMLESVNQCVHNLKYVSERLQNERELVKKAVCEDGYVIMFASEELQNDEELLIVLKIKEVCVIICL